jgi:hypothetical protein
VSPTAPTSSTSSSSTTAAAPPSGRRWRRSCTASAAEPVSTSVPSIAISVATPTAPCTQARSAKCLLPRYSVCRSGTTCRRRLRCAGLAKRSVRCASTSRAFSSNFVANLSIGRRPSISTGIRLFAALTTRPRLYRLSRGRRAGWVDCGAGTGGCAGCPWCCEAGLRSEIFRHRLPRRLPTGGGAIVERDQFLGRVRAARRGATLPDIAGPATAATDLLCRPGGAVCRNRRRRRCRSRRASTGPTRRVARFCACWGVLRPGLDSPTSHGMASTALCRGCTTM